MLLVSVAPPTFAIVVVVAAAAAAAATTTDDDVVVTHCFFLPRRHVSQEGTCSSHDDDFHRCGSVPCDDRWCTSLGSRSRVALSPS